MNFAYKILSLFLFLNVCLMPNSNAQDQDSTPYNWAWFSANNLNPGVSVGLGSGKLHGFIPSLTLKFGRFNIQHIRNNYYNGSKDYQYRESSLVSLDVFKVLKRRALERNYATFAIGWSYYNKSSNQFGKYIGEGMIGINRYTIGKRSVLSAKIGLRYFEEYDNDDYLWNPPAKTGFLPYGELAYNIYLQKFRERQRNLRLNELPSTFANFFNPYISFGLGMDRAVFMPAFGIKLGPINAMVSIFDDMTASGIMTLNVMVNTITLSESEKYVNKLGVGLAIFSTYVADISGSDDNIIGIMVDRASFKKGKHTSFHVKTGFGRARHDSWSYDFDTGKTSSSTYYSWVPLAGIGVNFYLLKL